MKPNQADNDARLREIIKELRQPGSNLDALIAETIQLCGPTRLRPHEWTHLHLNRDGYNNQVGIEYYLKPPLGRGESGHMPHPGMAHRERPGKLVVLRPAGAQADVSHEIAQRTAFFIGAPIAHIQELSELPGETSIIELADLTEYIGEAEGGGIALVVEKRHLEQMVKNSRSGVAALIDLVITPGRREALDEALKKPQGL